MSRLMLGHLFGNAIQALRERLLRSILIVLTVAMGIGAVLATVSLTNGLSNHVRTNTAKVGRSVSVIHQSLFSGPDVPTPMSAPGRRVTFEDVARLAQDLPTTRVDSDEAPVTFVPARIEYAFADKKEGAPRVRTTLVGTTHHYRMTQGYGLVAGRFLEPRDVAERRPVCVIDGGMGHRFFGRDADPRSLVGRSLTLHRGRMVHSLEVVGVLEEPYVLRDKFAAFDTVRFGRPAIFSRLNLLNTYVPITILSAKPVGATATVGGVAFEATEPVSAVLCCHGDVKDADTQAYEARLAAWAKKHDIAMFVLPQWLWLRVINDLVDKGNVAGHLIWIVILAVTIIMIMVINLVVVRERFREVAIRRTEGARRSDVLLQFMVESLVLSTLGGLLGLLVGTGAAHLLSEHVTGWKPAFELQSFLVAGGAALLIGVLSTTLPAWQASRLDPVKVLTNR